MSSLEDRTAPFGQPDPLELSQLQQNGETTLAPSDGHGIHFPPQAHVILVSDQKSRYLTTLTNALRDRHIRLAPCNTPGDIRQQIENHLCIALLFDGTEDGRCAEVSKDDIGRILVEYGHLRLIAITRSDQVMSDELQEMLRFGWLYDYHTIPLDMQRLLHTLGHLHGLIQLEKKYAYQPKATRASFGYLIGASKEMRAIYGEIERISKVDAPVLITGESGTGKELIARTIHGRSKTKNGKFVAINCAALPPSLIASELFGHEIGAYTGATRQKRGLIEDANEGTLFLDEIGDMPLEVQPYLLRFLQDGVFTRVGGTTERRIRPRMIAATNTDLREAIKQGTFREDLYYRLNILTIAAPPLRKHLSDIPQLAEHYLQKFCEEHNLPKLHFSKKALRLMEQHEWPGNVRELVGAVSRAAVLAKGPVILPHDLRLGISEDREGDRFMKSLSRARQEFDRGYIVECLSQNDQNVQKTARHLNISRVALYRLMKRYGIMKNDQERDNAA
ncbi:MAG: sigma-54-dependent Fis family transcriptional regulator [Proteobacteria bacterium]|nr:MAG: sigma-54-dependent Fis family transcriptional regulator [Pseudomonadota bacterium]